MKNTPENIELLKDILGQLTYTDYMLRWEEDGDTLKVRITCPPVFHDLPEIKFYDATDAGGGFLILIDGPERTVDRSIESAKSIAKNWQTAAKLAEKIKYSLIQAGYHWDRYADCIPS